MLNAHTLSIDPVTFESLIARYQLQPPPKFSSKTFQKEPGGDRSEINYQSNFGISLSSC